MVGVVAQASARTIRFDRGARIVVQESWCKHHGARANAISGAGHAINRPNPRADAIAT